MATQKVSGRLTTKLLVSNLLIPVIIFLGVTVYVYFAWNNFAVERVKLENRYKAESMANALNTHLEGYRQVVRSLASTPPLQGFVERGFPTGFLQQSQLRELPEVPFLKDQVLRPLADFPGVDVTYFAADEGPSLVLSIDIDLPPDFDARTRPWYLGARPLPAGEVFFSEPYVNAQEGQTTTYILTLSAPLVDFSGKTRGVAALDLDMRFLFDLTARFRANNQAQLSLYSRESLMILDSESLTLDDQVSIGHAVREAGVSPTEAENLERILASGGPFTQKVMILDDPRNPDSSSRSEYIQSVVPIPDTPWAMMVSTPFNPVAQEISSVLIPAFLLADLIFLAILALSYVWARRSIVRPVRITAEVLDDLSKGDGNLDAQVPVVSNDEVGTLARGFNHFVEKLRAIILSIRQVTREIIHERSDLVSTTDQTAAAAHEISSNVASIKTQILQLNREFQLVSDSIGQLQGITQGLNMSTRVQSGAVQEASASIEEMIASLRNVAQTVRAKREAALKLTGIIVQSGENVSRSAQANAEAAALVDQISEMSQVISGIASQTNLLSMNAAIEAAHAGDAGKGFAVVADEIRKLAESSSNSSTEIGRTVTEILQKVELAAEIARDSEAAFTTLKHEIESTIAALDEIHNSTEELTTGSEQIIKANNSLNEASQAVSENAHFMEGTIVQVNSSAQQAATISAMVSSGMEEIGTGVHEIALAVTQIQTVAQNLSASIGSLQAETDRFKTKDD